MRKEQNQKEDKRFSAPPRWEKYLCNWKSINYYIFCVAKSAVQPGMFGKEIQK
jgi:hypothetical protein